MKPKVIILVAVLIAAFASVSNAAVLLDRVVAIVNQDVITWSELYKAMEMDASPQIRDLNQDERLKAFKENETAFLETLINFRLQLQEAKTLGLSVGDDEVKEAMEGIKKKYSMTDADFNESLKKEGFTLDEYRLRLREQILVGKVVNHQIRSKILVSDAEVKKFLDGNKGRASDSGKGYRISQILFRKPKTDAEKSRVEEKAAEVLKKLKAGESFRELAKTYSEDPSASVGGDLGFIKEGYLLTEFSREVAKLKPGDVSEPFWSERGLHIIKLDEKMEGKNEREIAEEAKSKISEKIFEQRYTAWIKSLREKSFVDIRL